MQKISLGLATLTSFLVIVFLIQPLNQFVVVEANPFCTPTIFIESPDAYNEDIYQITSIPIKVDVSAFETYVRFVDMYYTLDGGPNIKLSITYNETQTSYFGIGTLDNLTNGYHTLKAYSVDNQGKILSANTTFLVYTTFRYPAFLLSPLNITYYSSEVSLTYSVDKQIGVVQYRLNNSGYKQLRNGNTTLAGLSEGQYTITVEAFSVPNGIYSKQTDNFTIDTTNPPPTSSPTPSVPEFSWLILLPLFLSILSIVVLIRKRKISWINVKTTMY
jgi:hypothetical protein